MIITAGSNFRKKSSICKFLRVFECCNIMKRFEMNERGKIATRHMQEPIKNFFFSELHFEYESHNALSRRSQIRIEPEEQKQ